MSMSVPIEEIFSVLIQFFQVIWWAIMISQHENKVSKARQKYVFCESQHQT